MAVHVGALGNTEELDPSQPKLRKIVEQFLPANFQLVSVINAAREVVLGVKFTVVFSFKEESKESEDETVCSILVLEKPWLIKDSEKYKSLVTNNCSLPEVPQISENEYSINPIFQNNQTTLSSEEMKELEGQIKVDDITTAKIAETSGEENDKTTDDDSSLKISSKNMLDDIFNLNNYYHTNNEPTAEIPTTTTTNSLSSFSQDALDNLFDVKKDPVESSIKKEEKIDIHQTNSRNESISQALEMDIKRIFSDLFQNDPNFQAAITSLIRETNPDVAKEKYNYIFSVIMSHLQIEAMQSKSVPEDSLNRKKRSMTKEDFENLANSALNELDYYDEDDNRRLLYKILNVKLNRNKNETHYFITVSILHSNCTENSTDDSCSMLMHNEPSQTCVFEVIQLTITPK